ncbi:cytidine deaminase [Seinonella peptonophila]|uniref:Cytidine deaminase n=1 Tax=Seinonella peptonophila TaxID=112248 RepID=A0A1M4V7E5_9BACL|nr:cytidine deaminase [Seinonella peptonophila]SHE64778.1 cytidine deaminase [Seinonella peptonophila]
MDQRVMKVREAQQRAYVPYSHFPVGAVVETAEGLLISGANIENASYGLTMCAERVALFKAYSEGYRQFRSLTVVANTKRMISPCGACRQVMSELCHPQMEVILINASGEQMKTTVEELLPYAFSEEDLP